MIYQSKKWQNIWLSMSIGNGRSLEQHGRAQAYITSR